VFGYDCRGDGVAVREHVGVLPERYAPFDGLSGREHVEYAIRSKGVDEDPADVLSRGGLRDDAARPAADYSKGMYQRLALAMALVGESDLLVLDEPTTGLDPNGAAEMRCGSSFARRPTAGRRFFSRVTSSNRSRRSVTGSASSKTAG
jgi:ABC-2 type transport system ATP-binding protein